jgi:hypothetical protein
MREQDRGDRSLPVGNDLAVTTMARRLVTHNLLHEAAYFEAAKSITWFSIRELSVFIDLFCLYDDIAVLDWNLRSFPRDGSSEFFGLLEDAKFVRNYEAHGDTRVTDSACAHLGFALGRNAVIDDCRQVVELCTNADFVGQVAAFFPREQHELQRGWDWLRAIRPDENIRAEFESDKDILRSTVFLVRTFLYASLAEVWGMPFVPDLARSSALRPMVKGEGNLRQQILEKLRTVFQEQPLGDDFGLTRNVTALAGIVFGRALEKGNVVQEMAKLRNELAPLRARLRKFEDIIQHGTAAEETAAKGEWSRAFEELEHEFGEGDGNVTINVILRLAAAASRILSDPTAIGRWIDAIMGQPKEWLLETLNKKPLIEIHQLRKDMPATGRLRGDIARLFNVV